MWWAVHELKRFWLPGCMIRGRKSHYTHEPISGFLKTTKIISLQNLLRHKIWYWRMAFILFVCLLRWTKHSWHTSGRKLAGILLETKCPIKGLFIHNGSDLWPLSRSQPISRWIWVVGLLWQRDETVSKTLNLMQKKSLKKKIFAEFVSPWINYVTSLNFKFFTCKMLIQIIHLSQDYFEK